MLIQIGWVRATLCGKQYLITSSTELSFANARIPLPELDALLPRVAMASKRYDVHIDLALFSEPGVLLIEESTEIGIATGCEPESFAWSSLCHAALAHMSANQRQRHIEKYVSSACNLERQEISSPKFDERLNLVRELGFAEEENSCTVSFPMLVQNNNVLGGIAIRNKLGCRNNLVGVSQDIRKLIYGDI